jgi:AraC family transcriptional regulator
MANPSNPYATTQDFSQGGDSPRERLRQHPQLDVPIHIEHLHNPPGEGRCHFKDRHTVFINLTPRPIAYTQAQDGKIHTGFYRKGDFTITPADASFFARWEGDEQCLQVQLSHEFVCSIAQETLKGNGDRLQLQPQFQGHDPQIDAIATMLQAELHQEQSGRQLYLDSLANILAVHLLRHHATTQPRLVTYEGGLPPHHLRHILDYMDAHLSQDIKLADLAGLLGMSQFHFSRLFKQALGISPYQYLIQQRVERAKRLLKQTNHAITDIALDCGFSSHSHLSKQFRQITGITPKAYRAGR